MILVMNVLELASSRSSVRRFKRDPVPLSDIRYILDVARRAPSGANRQPWRFLVVRDDEIKQIIRRECEAVEREFHKRADPSLKKWLEARGITWEKPFLTEAPFLILVFGKAGDRLYAPRNPRTRLLDPNLHPLKNWVGKRSTQNPGRLQAPSDPPDRKTRGTRIASEKTTVKRNSLLRWVEEKLPRRIVC